jgi:hypothetical protein
MNLQLVILRKIVSIIVGVVSGAFSSISILHQFCIGVGTSQKLPRTAQTRFREQRKLSVADSAPEVNDYRWILCIFSFELTSSKQT